MTDRQTAWVVNDLVTEGLLARDLEVAEISDGQLTLRVTTAGHQHLDEYFAAHRWNVTVSTARPEEDEAAE